MGIYFWFSGSSTVASSGREAGAACHRLTSAWGAQRADHARAEMLQ